MTDELLITELRSLRSELMGYNDRVVRLRMDDFKRMFVEQMRGILADEGRKALGPQLSSVQQAAACSMKQACQRQLGEMMEGVIAKLEREDQQGAMELLEGAEGLICGESTPCMDDGCSLRAAEAIRDVKALLSVYFTLRPRLLSVDRGEGGSAPERATRRDPESVERAIAPLSNARRVTILRLLQDQDRTLSELCKALEMKTGHLQFHIRALREAGYISSDKRRHIYSITEKGRRGAEGLDALMQSIGEE